MTILTYRSPPSLSSIVHFWPSPKSSSAWSASTLPSYSTSSTHFFARKKCQTATPHAPTMAPIQKTAFTIEKSVMLARYRSQGVIICCRSNYAQ